MEDFDEADVLWPEDPGGHSNTNPRLPSTSNSSFSFTSPASSYSPQRRQQKLQRKPSTLATTTPIGIPTIAAVSSSWSFGITCNVGGSHYVTDDEDDIDPDGRHGQEAGMIPPHLLLSSRCTSAPCQRKMAFSVCAGHGRTLKGRDLSQVRDMVLRLTGFLEPEG